MSISKTYTIQRCGLTTINTLLGTQTFEFELIPVSNTQAESYVIQQWDPLSAAGVWAAANMVVGGTLTMTLG